jgi:shikimate dehydrogenase
MLRLGLIGAGIGASRSPAMHVREAVAFGLAAEYRLFDLDELGLSAGALPHLLQQAEDEGFRGLNITHPCKQAVLHCLDDLSEDARGLGAVNTVVFESGRRIGYNTDWWAFRESLRQGLPNVSLDCVAVVGAGGAGAAVAYAVLAMGAEQVRVVDTDAGRADALAVAMQAQFGRTAVHAWPDVAAAIKGSSGIVHATPTGMASHPGVPFDPALLRHAKWLAEVVYVPLETELLRAARARGLRTLDGSGMAVHQAVRAFQLFTGRPADPDRMRQTFDEFGR